MVIIKSEVQLKQCLDSDFGIRFGDNLKDYLFIVKYRDNKSDTDILTNIVNSPISALRNLPTILEQSKLPVNDMDIVLIGALKNADSLTDYQFIPMQYLLKKEIYFVESKTKK